MPPRCCWRALASSLVVAAALLAAGGGGASPAQPDVARLRSEQTTLAARTHNALLDLYSLQTRLGAEQARLASLQTQVANVRAQQELVQREVAIASHAHAVSQRQLAQRLRALYEQGQPDPVAIVLGATSLDDAITSIDDLDHVAQQDKEISRQTASTRRSLTHLSNELATQTKQLTALEQQSAASVSALEQAQADRAALVATLRTKERLTRTQISSLDAAAQAAQAKTQQLATEATPSSSSTPPAVPPAPTGPAAPVAPAAGGSRAITVVATGYSLPGRTATGLPVGWGVAAVDPSMIPLGTHMSVPGYGEAVAADVGSGVRGAMIDLWFPTLAQARAWGRRTVTVTLH
jgi:peptidoglycan DL-endopeptidase CwlO